MFTTIGETPCSVKLHSSISQYLFALFTIFLSICSLLIMHDLHIGYSEKSLSGHQMASSTATRLLET